MARVNHVTCLSVVLAYNKVAYNARMTCPHAWQKHTVTAPTWSNSNHAPSKQANDEAVPATSPRPSPNLRPGEISDGQKESILGEETLELSGGTNQRSNPNHGRVTRGLALMHDKNTLFRPPLGAEHNAFFDMIESCSHVAPSQRRRALRGLNLSLSEEKTQIKLLVARQLT